MRKKLAAMLLAVVMAVGLLPLSACSGGTSAATMHLRRTEGTVSVSDSGGKDVPLLDNLGLYSGYGVGTRAASYAWIDLDDVKLTKLDQNSEISIEKNGKKLDIELKSGSLFFNVTKPLEDDETMNISTSTLLVGIRGTSGWVEERSGRSRVYILEGKVECYAEGQTVQVSAGEMAELMADGQLAVEPFATEDIPAFVRDDADPDLIGGVEGTPEPTPTPTPTPEPAGHERPTDETAWSYISVTTDGDAYYVEEPIMLNAPGPFEPWSLDHYTIVSQETELTVSNRANAEDDCYIQILIDEFYSRRSYDGQEYYQAWPMPTNYLTNEGVFDFMMPDDNILKLRPGESVTFTLADQEDLVYLRTRLYYPEYDYSWWSNWYILVDDEAASEPAEPTEPEPPAGGDPSSHIGLTMSGGSYSEVDDLPVFTRDAFYDWEEDVYRYESLDGCFALSLETQLTISNLANADDNCYIDDICLWTDTYYDSDENNCYLDGLYFHHLTNNDGFIAHMMYRDPEYGGPVQLRPGESVTLLLSEYRTLADEFGEVFLTYDLLVLSVSLTYPDAGQSEIVYYGFTFNE